MSAVATKAEEALPADGQFLVELGYVDESDAAAGLGITTKTLIEYRRMGRGPVHTEVARRILYSREAIATWLAAGGARLVLILNKEAAPSKTTRPRGM